MNPSNNQGNPNNQESYKQSQFYNIPAATSDLYDPNMNRHENSSYFPGYDQPSTSNAVHEHMAHLYPDENFYFYNQNSSNIPMEAHMDASPQYVWQIMPATSSNVARFESQLTPPSVKGKCKSTVPETDRMALDSQMTPAKRNFCVVDTCDEVEERVVKKTVTRSRPSRKAASSALAKIKNTLAAFDEDPVDSYSYITMSPLSSIDDSFSKEIVEINQVFEPVLSHHSLKKSTSLPNSLFETNTSAVSAPISEPLGLPLNMQEPPVFSLEAERLPSSGSVSSPINITDNENDVDGNEPYSVVAHVQLKETDAVVEPAPLSPSTLKVQENLPSEGLADNPIVLADEDEAAVSETENNSYHDNLSDEFPCIGPYPMISDLEYDTVDDAAPSPRPLLDAPDLSRVAPTSDVAVVADQESDPESYHYNLSDEFPCIGPYPILSDLEYGTEEESVASPPPAPPALSLAEVALASDANATVVNDESDAGSYHDNLSDEFPCIGRYPILSDLEYDADDGSSSSSPPAVALSEVVDADGSVEFLLSNRKSALADADLRSYVSDVLACLPSEDLEELAELLPWPDKSAVGTHQEKIRPDFLLSNNYFWESLDKWKEVLLVGGFEKKKMQPESDEPLSFKDQNYEAYWGERLARDRLKKEASLGRGRGRGRARGRARGRGRGRARGRGRGRGRGCRDDNDNLGSRGGRGGRGGRGSRGSRGNRGSRGGFDSLDNSHSQSSREIQPDMYF